MALTAQDLIDDAKLEAWPFVREEEISPAALLRQLGTLDREIVGFIAIQSPDSLAQDASPITVVQASNPSGYQINMAKVWTNFVLVSVVTQDRIPIEISANTENPSKHPAAFILGSNSNANMLFPIDPVGRDWDPAYGNRGYFQDGDTIEYRYITEPPRITTMSQLLSSPEEAADYFKQSLTLSILLHSQAPAERLQVAVQLLRERRQALMHEIIKKTGVTARYGEF